MDKFHINDLVKTIDQGTNGVFAGKVLEVKDTDIQGSDQLCLVEFNVGFADTETVWMQGKNLEKFGRTED